MKHLVSEWGALEKRLGKKSIFLFLDFDGTLAPLARTPHEARLPGATRRLLAQLAQHPACRVAIVSGRTIADVSKKIALDGIAYAGNHGLQVRGPDARTRSFVDPRFKRYLAACHGRLTGALAQVRGARIENKGLSLAVHYRLVGVRDDAILKKAFRAAVGDFVRNGQLHVKTGEKVFEVFPAVAWNKGSCVMWLLERAEKECKGGILALFAGDDLTDEDAFVALRNRGVTVFVGTHRPSAAAYYAADTHEVFVILKKLLKTLEKRYESIKQS